MEGTADILEVVVIESRLAYHRGGGEVLYSLYTTTVYKVYKL